MKKLGKKKDINKAKINSTVSVDKKLDKITSVKFVSNKIDEVNSIVSNLELKQ